MEMIFNRAFIMASDKNEFFNIRIYSFFQRILNEWLIHNRKHLFRYYLSGRQESCAQTGDRQNCFMNLSHHGIFYLVEPYYSVEVDFVIRVQVHVIMLLVYLHQIHYMPIPLF